jgi:hypothetical protein
VLVRLRSTRKAEWASTDQVYLAADGRMVWGIVRMRDDDTKDIDGSTEPIQFRSSVAIELWGIDTGFFDSDGLLGLQVLDYDEATLDQEQILEFRDDGASYQLTCFITDEP